MSTKFFNTELFRLNKDQLSKILSDLEINVYETDFGPKTGQLFSSQRGKLWHVVSLLQLEGKDALVQDINGEPNLLSIGKIDQRHRSCYLTKDADFDINLRLVGPIEKTEFDRIPFSLVRQLVNKGIKKTISTPVVQEGYYIYNKSIDLMTDVKGKYVNSPLVKDINVHPGISYGLKKFGGDYFLQILPHSRITYGKSMEQLLTNYDKNALLAQFPYVKIKNVGTARILEITDLDETSSIPEPPYFGRNFKDFAMLFHKNEQISSGVKLAKVALGRLEHTSFYPLNWLWPSITYTSIAYIDEKFHGDLIAILRLQSKKRPEASKNWVKQFSHLDAYGSGFEISTIPLQIHYDNEFLESTKLDETTNFEKGKIFAPPAVSFKKDNDEIEVHSQIQNYTASVNDLLTHSELKPLDVPNSLKLIVFVEKELEDKWKSLQKSLIEGSGAYRGFKNTFGTDVTFTNVTIDNFFSNELEHKLSTLDGNYDCAIVVIKRYYDTEDLTKRIYDSAKTQLMEKGLPVQVITEDKKTSLNRDNSLIGKSHSPYTLFGIAINILGKTGTILTAISEKVAESLIPNALVLGYNITRVFPNSLDIQKTVPLSAPLVLFDNRGAYLKHQEVHWLDNENSLFTQYGDEIFAKLPKSIKNLIIHKDGFFQETELTALEKLEQKYGINVIPISIRHSEVPRVSSINYMDGLNLKAGTCLPLSDKDFLLVTTPVGRWQVERIGWPNPILITIHKDIEVKIKSKILYHIFALTKMQIGAQRPTRLPISLHFSNMIAKFIRRQGDPIPKYLRHFVHTNPDCKYLPRWYL